MRKPLPKTSFPIILILGGFLISLSGCTASTTYMTWNDVEHKWDRAWRVESKGQVKTEVKPDGTVSQDSKNEPFIKIQAPDLALNKIGA